MENVSQAQNMLSSGNLYGIVIISSERNDVDYAITVVLDDSNPVLARSVYNAVDQVVNDMNEKIVRIPIRTETRFLYGPGFDYVHFLVPGVLAMTAMFSCALQTIMLVWEKNLGTIDRLLITPVRPSSIILGKTLAGCLTGVVQAILILIMAKLLFGIAIVNIYLVLLIIFLTSVTFTGIGVFVSGISRDISEAITYNQIILWPMIFLGGVFFPVEMIPAPIQYISQLLPLTYATDALRSIMIRQAPLTMKLVSDVLVLMLFAVTMFVLGSKTLLRVIVR